MKSRRHLLKTILLAGSLTMLSHAAANAVSPTYNDGLKYWETLQAEQLESLIGQSFSIYGTNNTCVASLESVQITDDPNRPTHFVRKQGFSAKLVPVGYECQKNDQIVIVSHPEIMGDGQVFVTAKNDGQDNWHLEIVFN